MAKEMLIKKVYMLYNNNFKKCFVFCCLRKIAISKRKKIKSNQIKSTKKNQNRVKSKDSDIQWVACCLLKIAKTFQVLGIAKCGVLFMLYMLETFTNT